MPLLTLPISLLMALFIGTTVAWMWGDRNRLQKVCMVGTVIITLSTFNLVEFSDDGFSGMNLSGNHTVEVEVPFEIANLVCLEGYWQTGKESECRPVTNLEDFEIEVSTNEVHIKEKRKDSLLDYMQTQ